MRVARESENEAGLSWFVKYGRLPPSIHILKAIRDATCWKDLQSIEMSHNLPSNTNNKSLLQVLVLYGSRKYPYPHLRGSLQILRGRRVLKAKIFKGMYEPKLEFPEGWSGSNQKNPPWVEYGYFLVALNLIKL